MFACLLCKKLHLNITVMLDWEIRYYKSCLYLTCYIMTIDYIDFYFYLGQMKRIIIIIYMYLKTKLIKCK